MLAAQMLDTTYMLICVGLPDIINVTGLKRYIFTQKIDPFVELITFKPFLHVSVATLSCTIT